MSRLTSIQIAGLGPVDAYRHSIPASAEGQHLVFAGPSECGKTTLIHALALLLTGQGATGSAWPVELIRYGAEKAAVAVALADGSALRRTIIKSRASTWTLYGPPQIAGDPSSRITTPIHSQAAWDAELGLDPSIVRAILCPDQVARLGDQARGRPLRDLLLSVLPQVEVRDVVRRYVPDLRDDEPVVEASTGRGAARVRGAADRATGARRTSDESSGALSARRAALAQAEAARPEPPPQTDVGALARLRGDADRAAVFLGRLDAYEALERAMDAHRAALDAIDTQHAAVLAWEGRRAALGEPPPHPGDCPSLGALIEDEAAVRASALEAARAAMQARAAQPSAAVLSARARAAAAEHAVDQALMVGEGTCETCGQVVTAEHAVKHRTAAEAEAHAAGVALFGAERADTAHREGQIATAKAASDEAQAALTRAEQALAAGRAAVAAHQAAMLALASHTRAVAALGPPPATPPTPPDAPAVVEPPSYRGAASEARARAEAMVAEHRAAVTRAAGAGAAAEGALAAWSRQVEQARAALAEAEAAEGAAAAELARAELVLDVLRRAPTEAAREAEQALVAALPARCGVRVVFGDLASGGPEAEVLIDGRPWWLASTGRQIAADLDLRLALRRLAATRYPGGALGYDDLPVIVDRANLWTGDLSREGAVWLLVSDPEASVIVE